jgi:hypothetical protein
MEHDLQISYERFPSHQEAEDVLEIYVVPQVQTISGPAAIGENRVFIFANA